LGAWCR